MNWQKRRVALAYLPLAEDGGSARDCEIGTASEVILISTG